LIVLLTFSDDGFDAMAGLLFPLSNASLNGFDFWDWALIWAVLNSNLSKSSKNRLINK